MRIVCRPRLASVRQTIYNTITATIYIYTHTHTYIYIYVCVCVCVYVIAKTVVHHDILTINTNCQRLPC